MDLRQKPNDVQRIITGLVLLSIMMLIAFTGVGDASSTAGNDPLSTDSAPIAPDQVWSRFRYIYAAGTTLHPRDSGQDWANSASGGCIYATSLPGEVMNLHLDIPTGSRIDYLRIFYYDTSASNSNAWVTTYDGASSYTDIASVSSSGSSGYSTSLSAYVGHVVDNYNDSYVLNWRPNVTGSTMMLCGLRVAYRVLLTESFLPLISR